MRRGTWNMKDIKKIIKKSKPNVYKMVATLDEQLVADVALDWYEERLLKAFEELYSVEVVKIDTSTLNSETILFN
ncbi:MAG: hypothetical protein AABY22_23755 [Nanoarchaeota archaeon]